jgi:hypothetical protein
VYTDDEFHGVTHAGAAEDVVGTMTMTAMTAGAANAANRRRINTLDSFAGEKSS